MTLQHRTLTISTTEQGAMARKSTPQPLALADPTIVGSEPEFFDNTRTPSSTKSPRSPTRIPPSQTTQSLSAFQNNPGPSQEGVDRERDRPARGGFFSNYKASKSSSRIQPPDTFGDVGEDSMSRDTDRPAMPRKASSQDASRKGISCLVSPPLFRHY